jgi:hypothetical protein
MAARVVNLFMNQQLYNAKTLELLKQLESDIAYYIGTRIGRNPRNDDDGRAMIVAEMSDAIAHGHGAWMASKLQKEFTVVFTLDSVAFYRHVKAFDKDSLFDELREAHPDEKIQFIFEGTINPV